MRAGTDDDRQLQLFTILHIKKQSVRYRILRSYKDTLHGPSYWIRTSGKSSASRSFPKRQLKYKRPLVCRDLIVVPPQYDQYLKYSKLTQAIYQRYTDLIEPFGMDECWLDVTGSRRILGDGMSIAEEIRQSVREELGNL